MNKLLEIEKILNITITMPQTCHFCSQDITKKFGMDSDSLNFHSIDHNHDNWDPLNKVPAHRKCHMKYHSGKGSIKEKYSKKFQNVGGTKGVIIPMAWIITKEQNYNKTMIGVHMDINEKLELTPMWEDQ